MNTSGRAGLVRRPLTPEEGTPSRARARRSGSPSLRDLGERLAREAHPQATEILVNDAHQDGPVVEVWGAEGFLALYRLTGYEL